MNTEKPGADQFHATEPLPAEMEGYEEISITDIFARLWRRRTAFLLWSVAITVVIVVLGGLIYLLQERREVAVLQFKLEFDGISKGEYPNGMKFSTSDILSVPVMSRVYEENDLKQYMTLPEFKGAVGVIQTNEDLRLLELEYESKLSSKQLTVQDRERIEAEFLGKRKALMIPFYTIRFAHRGLAAIPGGLMAEVLNDILRAWAEYADRVKGALKYRISIVSPNIIDKQTLEAEEYLAAVDMLQQAIARIKTDIGELAKIPGAETIKLEKTQLSLGDLRYQIEDMERFKLNPLASLVRQAGLSKNIDLSFGYLKNRLFELSLEKEEALAKKNVYDDSLKRYLLKGGGEAGKRDVPSTQSLPLSDESSRGIPAMIPQFGASFLDSLIQLGQENSDAQFRQKITNNAIEVGLKQVKIEFQEKYYKQIVKEMADFQNAKNTAPEFREAAIEKVRTTFDSVYKQIVDSINQLNSIYLALSKYNLQPDSMLYSILEPVVIQTSKAVSAKRLLMFMVLAFFLAEAVLLFGTLIATPSNPQRGYGR